MSKAWKRHSADEIVAKLNKASHLQRLGAGVADAASAIGVTLATYYRWRKSYAGLIASQVRQRWDSEARALRLRKVISEFEIAGDLSAIEEGRLEMQRAR